MSETTGPTDGTTDASEDVEGHNWRFGVAEGEATDDVKGHHWGFGVAPDGGDADSGDVEGHRLRADATPDDEDAGSGDDVEGHSIRVF